MGTGDIDLNLGLVQRPLPNNGPHISMVKSRPGVYFDAAGDPATDEMAIAAGFDVPKDRLLKKKSELLAEATAEIEEKIRREMAAAEAGIDEKLAKGDGDGSGGGEGDKVDDGSPFVHTNANNRPREARLVQGGPVREMEYFNSGDDKGWTVRDRDSGQIYDARLEEEQAVKILLEE